jgi:hypothetical protein
MEYLNERSPNSAKSDLNEKQQRNAVAKCQRPIERLGKPSRRLPGAQVEARFVHGRGAPQQSTSAPPAEGAKDRPGMAVM